ncbi:PAS domain S-box-containing protein [Tindallia magadiensis]|uniref:PAS domain S-box-containing protein n=1 Tax=Tindallia magadiensis TaxID=69895 RepID=A0A1I3C1S9_9FIRM|nr:[Fe-Fe] hydrogenase large subunit C-terminal domain-containing protein [Tindallia magadiensis]SFH67931.1 PAS domain S-box-containing protein [Tindallia magadiensis]
MKFINHSMERCNNCYRCIRACSPKAISIFDSHARIDQDRCISCGECYVACEQGALHIKNVIDHVKEAIASPQKVVASLSPAFSSAFGIEKGEKMVESLKKLGFDVVEEEAVGGDVVAKAYEDYLGSSGKKNIIASTCPSTNYLIEKYHSSLRQYMVPIVSPMIAHGRILRKKYGADSYIVYVGPCLAKKAEAREMQHRGLIKAVLTFVELEDWLKEEGIGLENLEGMPFDAVGTHKGRCIPFCIDMGISKNKNFEKNVIAGVSNSEEILSSLEKDELEGLFLGIASCDRGCINGTGMPKDDTSYYVRRKRMTDYNKKIKALEEQEQEQEGQITSNQESPPEVDLSKIIYDQKVELEEYSAEEINETLMMMGKSRKEDQLNCHACGYGTCRAKAESVLRGTSHVNMCLPFMRAKAESLKNVIFDNSPNAIFMVGPDLKVKEFNPSSERIFQIRAEAIKDRDISTIIPSDLFEEVLETRVNLIGRQVEYHQYGVILIVNILYLSKEGILMAIMTDVTSAEKNKKELIRVRENTLNVAQDVIDKQMRVAQEIASLLGETTAETKVTLTKLQDLVVGDRGDER